MKGLYINFELKRRSKLAKVMDYFFVVAIGVLAFILLFYMPYVTRSNEYNKAEQDKQALIARKADLEQQILPYLPENASVLQQNYNKAYNQISDNIINHADYIRDLYTQSFDGVIITRIGLDTANSKITLGITFADNTSFWQYKSNLTDLPWIPYNGITWEDTKLSTTWEVLIDEPAI